MAINQSIKPNRNSQTERTLKLPIDQLQKGCTDPKGMEELIMQAESVLRTWQQKWSPFLSGSLIEEALQRLTLLNGLHWHAEGGHPGAERQRLLCRPYPDDSQLLEPPEAAPILGLIIEGNFLFDRATPTDIRTCLEQMGVQQEELGDIWIRGDRGAEAICTPEAALRLHKRIGMIRAVEISCEKVLVSQLNPPYARLPKRFSSVEASSRLDAIASAGFGISRAKIVSQIKAGRLRVNWHQVSKPSIELVAGDRLQLQDRGVVEILKVELTKRQRWRVEMLRR